MTEEKQTDPVYDPSKSYKWQDNDNFYINGKEFGLTLNGLRAILNTEAAQIILLAERASRVMENALARAVTQGIAKEEMKPVVLPPPLPDKKGGKVK